MQSRLSLACSVIVAGLLLGSFVAAPASAAAPIEGEMPPRPGARIDVVFVFDSTGSMSKD